MDGGARAGSSVSKRPDAYCEFVEPKVYDALEAKDFESLTSFSKDDLRPILPVLMRSIQSAPASQAAQSFRRIALDVLLDVSAVNQVALLIGVDFQAIAVDMKHELQMRHKVGVQQQDSYLVQNVPESITFDFERCDYTRKIRLIFAEIIHGMSQIHDPAPRWDYYMKASELLDSRVYLNDICDCISITLMELPNLISLCDICEALLHVQYGPLIIPRIVANMPDSFLEVCMHLISNGEKYEEDNEGGLTRLEAVKNLCRMNTKQRALIRSKCIEMCKMPALCVFLTLDDENMRNDLVSHLSGLLLSDLQIRNWFSGYIRNSQKRKLDSSNSLTILRNALFAHVDNLIDREKQELKAGHVVQASCFLRLMCAIRGIANFKFLDEEITSVITLITMKAPRTQVGFRFVTLGLCALFACPNLLNTAEHEKTITEWVRGLILDESVMTTGPGTSSCGEILLLIAIHFHSNQLSAISDLIATTIPMKVPVRLSPMNKLRNIFTQDIFTEQVVTTHAVKVAVTSSLSANVPGFLPVHCIYQLIKSRAFSKYHVPIKDWIYRQLLSSVFPIHPVWPNLLEVYAQSIITPGINLGTKLMSEPTNEPILEEEIVSVFQGDNQNLAPQLLLLYYVLLYEDFRLANCRMVIHRGKRPKPYSAKLFSMIPIKYLVQESQRKKNACGGLFPSLLKLLTTHFPQLCITSEWSKDLLTACEIPAKVPTTIEIPPGRFTEAIKICRDQPVHAIRLLKLYKNLPPHDLWKYAEEIVSEVNIIILPDVKRRIQELFAEVWYELNNVYPRRLWEITTNALLPVGSLPLTADEFTIDPLQVLRCDTRVFRCAPVLNILLHILSAALASSKYFFNKHLQENPALPIVPGPGALMQSDIEKDELKSALIAVQDSAAVQILLEACMPLPEEKGVGSDLKLIEIQSILCSYLHQVFISDPAIVRLVHFQGYPLELIPITVRGIPSMHICLDYIAELLAQPHAEKQIFAIQLTSYLAMRYSLPKSMEVAKIVFNSLNNLSNGVLSVERAEFFIPCLSALERFCTAFPPLANEACALLVHLGQMCVSQNSIQRKVPSMRSRREVLYSQIVRTYKVIINIKRSLC